MNDVEVEGFTEDIETGSAFSVTQYVNLPSELVNMGHNEVRVCINITAPENIEDSVSIKLSQYQIKTK
ncbi:hypothetical protein IH574_03155 [Candidatus Bathyarchaeota archaeon]|nr:hypothetical protein [Candidatus Bathyarchaeota archaeon]